MGPYIRLYGPTSLPKRIYGTHAVGDDLCVPVVSRVKAEVKIISSKHGKLETLIGYKNRFTEAVKTYIAGIGEVPDAAILAYRYVVGLHPGRFRLSIAYVVNNARNGIQEQPFQKCTMLQSDFKSLLPVVGLLMAQYTTSNTTI